MGAWALVIPSAYREPVHAVPIMVYGQNTWAMHDLTGCNHVKHTSIKVGHCQYWLIHGTRHSGHQRPNSRIYQLTKGFKIVGNAVVLLPHHRLMTKDQVTRLAHHVTPPPPSPPKLTRWLYCNESI